MRQRIRLTESELRNIIREAVEEELNEADMDEGLGNFFRGAANKVGGDLKNAAEQGVEQAKNAAGNAWNATKNAAGNAWNNITKGAKSVRGAVNRGAKSVRGAVNRGANAVGDAVSGAWDATKQYAADVKKAGQQASNAGDLKKAQQIIDNLYQQGYITDGVYKILGQKFNAINNKISR